MDEIRAFFNNPRPSGSQMIRLRTPVTCGTRITKENPLQGLQKSEEHSHSESFCGTDYARQIREREKQIYERQYDRDMLDSQSQGLNSLEQLSIDNSSNNMDKLNEEAVTNVYKKYSFQKKEDTNNLAINHFHSSIMDTIKSFPVVIIEGPTGCGKTTQVPQWILDDAYNNRRSCKIVVTQPRKIAAISIAKRVAQERGWNVGGVVGYQVGLENKTCRDTMISYVTTGVLLQKLVKAKNMNEYTHIVLDEVHERGQEMDFLLLVVKKYLNTVSRSVKVVLMSATFNRQSFAEYFLIPTPTGLQKTPCFKVTNEKSPFTVKTFYLNHLHKFGSLLDQATPKDDEPVIKQEMYHLVLKLLYAFESIDSNEEYTDRDNADLPSVLVFLPGINEIEELFNCLSDTNLRTRLGNETCANYKWQLLPLHSTITADEQVRVFQRLPLGTRKIILATNIAESSITVPDIKYVIDFCLMKILVADQQTNFTALQLAWASKTNCEQRAGRAGRVRDGRVYRLVSETFYDNLSQECTPELLRCPLERLVLLAKELDLGPPSDILALAMDPPDLSNIYRTILVLKEIGALKKTVDDEWSKMDGDVTYLGRVMAKLPLDVRASKLIMLGYIFGCFEESIIMAASMSVKNVFSSPFRERLNAYNSKLTWADGSTSDCIAQLNVYKVWTHLRQQHYFRQNKAEVNWSRSFYVQIRALYELDDMVRELRQRTKDMGMELPTRPTPWTKQEITLVLKMILAGAFYPQYFVQASHDEERERLAVRELSGLDPRTTVYFRGIPDQQPAAVYAPVLRNLVKRVIGDDPRVTVDKNSRKIFVTFDDVKHSSILAKSKSGDPTIPGEVVLPVYKAVKARHLRMEFRIPLLSVTEANELAKLLESNQSEFNDRLVPRLPDIDETHIPIKLSHFIDVDKFWAQYDDESTARELNMIQKMLNNKPLLAITEDLTVGLLLAAPYAEGGHTLLYRARVTRLLPRDLMEVVYTDYGGNGRVSVCSVRELPEEALALPPLAMRCTLTGIAPVPLQESAPGTRYTIAAQQLFSDLVARPQLIARVYSVTHGVVSMELLADGGKTNVNQLMLTKGLAVACEERYESKRNHELRETAATLSMSQKRAFNREQAAQASCEVPDTHPPAMKDCISDVVLKGPHSPLESSLRNLMYASRDKTVQVEWNSVNSVLLDTDPQEIYDRLLVAADVGHNEESNRMTLRHTTVMPNIRGLPAIISLLFCPSAELRRSASGSRYVSVLCGLGSTSTGQPYFPEHDLLVSMDADMDVEDIGLINHIRHIMDCMIFCKKGCERPSVEADFGPKAAKYIRDDLLKLLLKRRKHREPESVLNEWEWKSVPESELLELLVPDMTQRTEIYPLHTPLELYPMTREQALQLKRDTEQLKILVNKTLTSSSGEMRCKLCGTAPLPTQAMRIHLASNAHKEKEEELRVVQQ